MLFACLTGGCRLMATYICFHCMHTLSLILLGSLCRGWRQGHPQLLVCSELFGIGPQGSHCQNSDVLESMMTWRACVKWCAREIPAQKLFSVVWMWALHKQKKFAHFRQCWCCSRILKHIFNNNFFSPKGQNNVDLTEIWTYSCWCDSLEC